MGGTWFHYGNYYGDGLSSWPTVSLPETAFPLNGAEWTEGFTLWFAADFVAFFGGSPGYIVTILDSIGCNISADKDQFWSWYSGSPNGVGGSYNDTPRIWYGLTLNEQQIDGNGKYTGSKPLATAGTEAFFADAFLFPVYSWHGVVMSFNFQTQTAHSRFLNMHTRTWYNFDHVTSINPGHLKFFDMLLNPNHFYSKVSFHALNAPTYTAALKYPSKMAFQPMGCMSQFGFHNKYMDLTTEINRDKFFCDDGIQDVGRQAEKIWGEPVLFFSENSDAMRNTGTLDFTHNGQPSYHHPGKATGITPQYPEYAQPRGGGVKIGTCLPPINYVEGLFYAHEQEEPYFQNGSTVPARAGTVLSDSGEGDTGFKHYNFVADGYPFYGSVTKSGVSTKWKTGASYTSGWYHLYARTAYAPWQPAGGDFEFAWHSQPSELARKFAPNAGTAPFHGVWHFKPEDTSSYNDVSHALFSVGQTYGVSGTPGDGWACRLNPPSSGANPGKMVIYIPATDGSSNSYVHSETVEYLKINLFQVRYDPDSMEIQTKLNGGAWETHTLIETIRQPNTGALIGAARYTTAYIWNYCGDLYKFYFYHGLKTDAESDGFWNDGKGVYWDKDVNSILEVPTPSYAPAAKVITPGDQNPTETDYYTCQQNVTGTSLSVIGRFLSPRIILSGGSYVIRGPDVFLPYALVTGSLNMSCGSGFDFNLHNRINHEIFNATITDLDGIPNATVTPYINNSNNQGHERLHDWQNYLACWRSSDNFCQIWLWNSIRGWQYKNKYGFGSGTCTFLSNGTHSFGRTTFSSEFWVSHLGLDTQYIDWSVAANRDMFFDPDDGRPKQIDESGWTEFGGTQPVLWAPNGDLANHLGSMAQWVATGAPANAPINACEPYLKA